MKPSAPVARRYAKALHGLAAEAGRAEAIADELSRFAGLLDGERELRDVLARPWVKAATKRSLVVAVADRLELSPLARNFLALVAQRRRFGLLVDGRFQLYWLPGVYAVVYILRGVAVPA